MMWIGIAMVVVGVVMYSVGIWRGKRMREDGKYTPLEDAIEMDFQFRNVNPNRAPKGGPPVSQTKPLKLVKTCSCGRDFVNDDEHKPCCGGSIANPAGRSE